MRASRAAGVGRAPPGRPSPPTVRNRAKDYPSSALRVFAVVVGPDAEGGGQLVAVADAEFGVGPVEVAFDRPDRDDQAIGDFSIGAAERRQSCNLAFTCRQRR